MKALLLDLDGVIYDADTAIPGAAKTVRWLVQRRIPHLFLTNTSSKPRAALVDKLARFGIETRCSEIWSPPAAAASWLRHAPPGPVALFAPPPVADELADFELLPDGAEAGARHVVVGDLGEGWDFRTLNRAFRLLHSDQSTTLVALGLTRYWRAEDGLRLDVAPFVAALQAATGREPVVLGKPSRLFFEAALETLRVVPADAAMIGDDVRTDVGGAQAAGLRGVLVRTGKFREQDLDGGVEPDAILGSIADLPAWWAGAAGA